VLEAGVVDGDDLAGVLGGVVARGGGSTTATSRITGLASGTRSASFLVSNGFFLAAMMPLSDGRRAPSPW
jgi:hypothetical protein